MDIGDDDGLGTMDFGHGGAKEANGSGAEDENGASLLDGCSFGGMHSYAQWLEDRS